MISIMHLEMTSRCALKCPRCPRTMYPGSYKITELDLEILKKVLADPLLQPRALFVLAGNYGDAIYHSDLPLAVKLIKEKGFLIELETNGTGRSIAWWKELIEPLTKEDCITFSIDGLADTLTKYRVGARWNDIMEGIQVCRDRVTLKWKFILFRHNQHQISEAENLSKQLGFNLFKLVRSSRFGSYWSGLSSGPDPLEPIEVDIAKPVQISGNDFEQENPKQIHPRCLVESLHYISSEGLYFPSCWLGIFHDLKKSFLMNRLGELSLAHQTLSEVLKSAIVRDLKESWENWTTAPAPCQYACSKKKKSRSMNQFEVRKIESNT